jgi:predicted Zn finger-like uncharacterized protein
MILTCPSCATSYFAPDDAIPAGGRKVRCQSCAHIWHATAEEPLTLSAAAAPTLVSGPAETVRALSEDVPPVAPETPAPELPKAFRARAEQQRRIRRAATHGAVWAGLASIFVGILAGGWLFRVEVVDLWPRAAAAYAMVGTPVNPTGLEFEAVAAKAMLDRPDMVMVSGALRNVRGREVQPPPVRVALLDDHGAEIGHAVITLDGAPVLPGGVQGFAAMIRDPAAKGVDVGLHFVGTTPAPHAEAVADSHGEGHDEAPPAGHDRPLPAADDHGMRPAIIEATPTVHADPIDAQPIEQTGHAAEAAHH